MNHLFRNEPILSGTIQFTDRFYREPGNVNRSVILFQNAALFQDHLIVNVIDHQEVSHGRAAKYNNYMLFRITGDSLEKAGAFRTDIGERGVTRTFCMN